MSEKAAKKKAPRKAAKRKTTKSKSEPKPESATTETPAQAVDVEPSPEAFVQSRYEGSMHERHAKGFSFGELAAAGLTKVVALGLGVPVDLRRRSTLEENTGVLKAWYKPAPKKAKEEKPEKAKPAKPAKKGAKKSKKEQA